MASLGTTASTRQLICRRWVSSAIIPLSSLPSFLRHASFLMAVYAYKAIGTDGLVRGSIAADTARQARDQLRARGLRVEEIRSQTSNSKANWLWGGTNRYEARLVPIVRELSTLLSAAIPLSDALRTVTKQQRGRMGNALALVCDRVSAGRSLAEAMERDS